MSKLTQRQLAPLLAAVVACAVLGGVLLLYSSLRPDFRMACERVSSDPSGLTVRVARASHLDDGTTFSIQYGDGTSDGHSDGSPGRAKVTHTYRTHGSYQVRAQTHLSSNRVQDYSITCDV